jgi:3-dehydroquinate synthase
MKQQELIFTNQVGKAIDAQVAKMGNPRSFVLVDNNVETQVLPLLQADSAVVKDATVVVIPAGDIHKDLNALSHIWTTLTTHGATRGSLLINVGGGVVTDIGGFAASTFKRGIKFINVPTTLLGAVDAAVGGKTGINFAGFKNEIGVFREAEAVIISSALFGTLPERELLSGYAEMLKHGLLKGESTISDLLDYSPVAGDRDPDPDKLLELLKESVLVKRDVVAQDPTEKGIRRALNLGHTVGHAFESFALKNNAPVPHGYAVAWGCVVELVLSHLREGFPSVMLRDFAEYVYANYRAFNITCDDYPKLIEFMRHDKKNASPDAINFTLLRSPGDIVIDVTATAEEIKNALDIYRDLMHI